MAGQWSPASQFGISYILRSRVVGGGWASSVKLWRGSLGQAPSSAREICPSLVAPAAWPLAHRSCGPGAGWPHSFESHGCKGAGHGRVGACVLGRDTGVVRVVGEFGVQVSSQGFERRPEGFSSSARTVTCWAAPLSSVVSRENDLKVLNGGGHREAPFSGSVSTAAGHEGH